MQINTDPECVRSLEEWAEANRNAPSIADMSPFRAPILTHLASSLAQVRDLTHMRDMLRYRAPFTCPYCKSTLFSSSTFRAHILGSACYRKMVCFYCKQEVEKGSTLEQHVKTKCTAVPCVEDGCDIKGRYHEVAGHVLCHATANRNQVEFPLYPALPPVSATRSLVHRVDAVVSKEHTLAEIMRFHDPEFPMGMYQSYKALAEACEKFLSEIQSRQLASAFDNMHPPAFRRV